jgi:hypothetical protein
MVGSIAVTSSVRSLVAVADEADLVEAISLIVRNPYLRLVAEHPGLAVDPTARQLAR